jgi:hypothetical protein
MATVYGSNVRVSSDRAYDLGWRPSTTLENVQSSITKEVMQYVNTKFSQSCMSFSFLAVIQSLSLIVLFLYREFHNSTGVGPNSLDEA